MFPYTVYGVSATSSRSAPLIPAVDRVSAISATRPVQKSWIHQYGNSGQPQHILRAQRASRDKKIKFQQTENSGQETLKTVASRGPKTSIDDIFIKETTALLPFRVPVDRIPPEYIKIRSDDLTDYLKCHI